LALASAALIRPGSAYGLVLPPGNARLQHRTDPALFLTEWAPPPALNGTGSLATRLDATIHSAPGEARTWVDLLYPFEWERNFNGGAFTSSSRQWWWLSYVAAGIYVPAVHAGQALMKPRKPFGLKAPLALWNLLLAVFSFIGAARTVPHLLLLLKSFGVEYTLCRAAMASYASGSTGFWVAAFILSKYAELIDTAFLVLRKKPVGFLHWYHHTTVLLYCWHSGSNETPTGIYFAAMNYSVHAIMYFYYFLAAVCAHPPKWGKMVTILQLSQMAVGILTTVLTLRTLLRDSVPNCDGHLPNVTAALGMYASYFYLFAAFFVARFGAKPAAKSPAKAD